MKISIIISLYNKAPYVIRTLESVKAQTCKDWVCLIVNDGSTDESADVVREWLEVNTEHLNGKFWVINQENAGVSVARNRGLAESKGEYVCFLDADDWWAPSFLEEMVGLAEIYPEAGLYACNYIYYKPGKTRVGVKKVYGENGLVYDKEGWSGYINYPKSYYENKGQVVWTGATMLKRSIIEKQELRNENGEVFPVGITLGEDFLLWARIALKYPIAFLIKPLAYYNNDIPAKLRLTQNLHKPEAHMLWHLDDLKMYDERLEVNGGDWKTLFDWLRVSGLVAYWMSGEYNKVAAKELAKVDISQMSNVYTQPIWWMRFKKWIITLGHMFSYSLLIKRFRK